MWSAPDRGRWSGWSTSFKKRLKLRSHRGIWFVFLATTRLIWHVLIYLAFDTITGCLFLQLNILVAYQKAKLSNQNWNDAQEPWWTSPQQTLVEISLTRKTQSDLLSLRTIKLQTETAGGNQISEEEFISGRLVTVCSMTVSLPLIWTHFGRCQQTIEVWKPAHSMTQTPCIFKLWLFQ